MTEDHHHKGECRIDHCGKGRRDVILAPVNAGVGYEEIENAEEYQDFQLARGSGERGLPAKCDEKEYERNQEESNSRASEAGYATSESDFYSEPGCSPNEGYHGKEEVMEGA